MIMKICSKCNTKYKISEECPNGCGKLTRRESAKVYDRYQRKNADIYHDTRWISLTNQCKDRFNGIDIYQLYKYNKIVPGILSHHIEPIEDNKARAFDIENLIYLSDESHSEIHKIYNASISDKSRLQALLFLYVKRYVEGM